MSCTSPLPLPEAPYQHSWRHRFLRPARRPPLCEQLVIPLLFHEWQRPGNRLFLHDTFRLDHLRQNLLPAPKGRQRHSSHPLGGPSINVERHLLRELVTLKQRGLFPLLLGQDFSSPWTPLQLSALCNILIYELGNAVDERMYMAFRARLRAPRVRVDLRYGAARLPCFDDDLLVNSSLRHLHRRVMTSRAQQLILTSLWVQASRQEHNPILYSNISVDQLCKDSHEAIRQRLSHDPSIVIAVHTEALS